MPVNGNSYNIGRRYEGPNDLVAALDTERSRKAFRQRIKMRESRALELREYTYRYIYRWTLQEKLSLINSYGEINRVRDRNNIDEVDNQLVETLLINLTEAELNQIISNVNAQTQELKQKMKTYSKNADARSKHKLAQDFYQNARPNGVSNKQRTASVSDSTSAGREIQKNDPTSFKANRATTKMIPGLDKELTSYLKVLPLKDLLIIARRLKIDFSEDITKDKIIEEIKYLVSIYLSAITGKSRTFVAIPVDEEAIKEIERLVGFTSSAWMVGKPILSPKSLKAMREKARLAKSEMEVREKAIEKEIKNRVFKSKEFQKMTGISGSKKDIERSLELNDQGFLKDYSFDELMSKAYELGLDPDPRKSSVGEIKAAIYAKLSSVLKERKHMEIELAKARAADMKAIAKGKMRAGAKSSTTQSLEDRQKSFDKLFGTQGNANGVLQRKASGLAGMDNILSSGGNIPLVEFDAGELKTRNVTQAVPVFIVGNSSTKELYELGKKELEAKEKEQKDKDFIAGISGIDAVLKAIDKRQKKIDKASGKSKQAKAEAKSFKEIQKEEKAALKELAKIAKTKQKDFLEAAKSFTNDSERAILEEKMKAFTTRYSEAVAAAQSVRTLPNARTEYETLFKNIITDFKQDKQTSPVVNPVASLMQQDPTSIGTAGDVKDKIQQRRRGTIRKTGLFDKDGNEISLPGRSATSKYLEDSLGKKRGTVKEDDDDKADLRKYLNTAARYLLKDAKLDTKAVTPVFITNGFTEYLNDRIDDGFRAMTSATVAIFDYLSNVFPIYFAGLQQAGTAFNVASPASAMAKILDIIQQGMNASALSLLQDDNAPVLKYATGGTGKASQAVAIGRNANISQFITGDSKTSKPNPELVTVDWTNKRFAVKPANNDGNTVTNKTTMTTKERSSAFKVSFSEATIRYQKTNDGETSDNIALKVYPVTPGITDKIDINGTPMSVIDLMSGMYLSLNSIESLMGTNVELSKVIAANTINSGTTVISGESVSPSETFPTNLDSILRGE